MTRIHMKSVVLLSGMTVGLGFGCADDNGDGNGSAALLAAYYEKLDACGLLSEGEFPSAEGVELEPEFACNLACMVAMTCDEFAELTCGPFGMPTAEFLACYEDCQAAYGEADFVCDDGSEVPGSYQCDSEPDCEDGSDEVGCVEFACTDGSTVPGSYECDGVADCPDGNDELGCPGLFQCADGMYGVPDSYKCDGDLDCEDGSDEAGCPTYACADGQMVVGGARCNLEVECEDGSDEAGCASLCP